MKYTPTSLIQRQFWFAQQLDSSNSAYNIPSGFIIKGSVDLNLLKTCIEEIISSYEIFRTTYVMKDGELQQAVSEEILLDTLTYSINARDDAFAVAAKKQMDAVAAMPFELENGPVVRYAEIKSNTEDQCAFIIVVHHIAIDLRSKDLLSVELSKRYDAATSGAPLSQDGAVPQYSEFCEWQTSWLQSEKAAKMASFWKKQLEGRTQAIPLQPDFSTPSAISFKGDLYPFSIAEKLASDLTAFGTAKNLDVYVVLLAAYFALLYHYTRCTDFMVGIPLSNRRDAKFKDMMGCFVNTLPLSVNIDENESFEALARKVRMAMLTAHRNQELPTERIVTETASRQEGRNPLYQVGFTFEHAMDLTLGSAETEKVHCNTGGAQLELFLRCWHTEAGVDGQLEFNTAVFEQDTARRFVRNFTTLLASIVQDESKAIKDLAYVSEADLQQLATWNSTERDYPIAPLHEAFEKQAARTPDATALSFNGHSMTYRALNERSNQLAHYLAEQGIGRNQYVPVFMDRSLEMWVAIMGICKTGAAYAPMVTDTPVNRIMYMLRDAAPRLMLTTSDVSKKLDNIEIPVISLDNISSELNAKPKDNLSPGVTDDDNAYIIYTSGSTGKPKGVINTSRGIANRLCWMQETFPLDSSDRVLAKTPFGFDVSVWEIFWPLQVGASIEIAPPEAHKDPGSLFQLIKENGVTTLHFVPSMLESFLAYPDSPEIPALKRVICSGEALSYDLQNHFLERYPEVELHNLYGPTEAAVDVTHWPCSKGDDRTFVPIGKAIANTTMYVVDPHLNQTGIGVPGELCIGGVQVAKGYLNNETLTAKQFVANPFSKGTTLYKTGDKGRFLPDGSIQYLGRLDQQVKIRGNRIELPEIETVLRTHPAVQDAAVVARPVGNRPLELVAAIEGDRIEHEVLRRHITKELPEYMLPAFYVFLEKLPHTTSGKIDRKSLVNMPIQLDADASSKTPPRTSIEKILVESWKRVLDADQIGIRDNFFDIGGNSLLLMKVFADLKQRIDHPLQSAQLFQYTTIERLADYLDAETGSPERDAVPPPEIEQRAKRVRSAYKRRRKPT